MRTILHKCSYIIVICLASNFLFGQIANQKSNQKNQFKDAELVRESKFSPLPSYIEFRKSNQIDIDELKGWMRSNFKFTPNMGFNLLRKDTDKLGHVHYRYQQTFDGKPIEDAIWLVHTKKSKIYSLNGLIYNSISSSSSAGIDQSTALEKALIHIGAETYKWELPEEEKHLKWEKQDPTATYLPKGELVYVTDNYSFKSDSYRLAYKFNVYAHQPVSRSEIYVDANSGEILRENEIIHHVDEPGTAHTAYSDDREIIADSFEGEYRLRDASRGDGVRTFDMNTGTSYAGSEDFIDDDNDWNNINPELDEYGTDAHWGAETTYDYFFDIHGRNSIDNTGFQLNSYVHYGVDYYNAFWDGSRMTYGDGNGGSVTPLTSLDIAGHEVTHGLTTFTAGLIYYAESGALNESFSDIFGTAIERFGRPDDYNWLIGEDIGTHFRSMSNPNSKGDPDTYMGDFWADLGGGDSGGVHTNSGVQNFWFYLLTEGGTGTNDNGDAYDVTSLGIEAASAIAFRNLTVYLTSSSQYDDARFYALRSAEDLYGGCTFEVEETANAWYAVGVGDLYDPSTIADFSTLDEFGCALPFEVNFTNESFNGLTYAWDFGDGETSEEENPTHVYTEAGTYTVTLAVDGGSCGSDDITYTDFIVVNPDADCIVILPPSGTLSTQRACEGTVYDSGGPTDDYGGGENAQVTIDPLGAISVNLTFIDFDVEAGPGATCNYDYLEVYDGPDIYSPLIGRYCNNNLPSDMTSSGSAITLFFHSDGGLELDGFEIEWTCNPPEDLPEADFTVNSEITCSGFTYFTDLSTNIPITWDWDFGDGETSSEQHPIHEYTTEGIYTVTLIATNLLGPDTEIKTDYITVAFPEAPAVIGDTNCVDQTATLEAIGEGTLKWYDTESGGTPFFEGLSYTTPPLVATTTYYVEDDLFDSPEYVGPEDNAFGTGDYFSGDQYLIFNNPSPVFLKSVDVYAGSEEERTIELRNSAGELIETRIINVVEGENTLVLDLAIPLGTGLQLGVALGSSPDLYRNDSGASYPYTLDESVEIVGSSTGSENYYFFYNWEIHPYNCASNRTAVTAEVEFESDIMIDPVADLCVADEIATLNASEDGGTWSASCADCIDPETGEFDPSAAGVGTWEITYSVEGTCSHFNTISIDVNESDIAISPIEDVCIQSASFIITASEDGGTWSASCDDCIDPSTGEFDPSISGEGTWEITYSVPGTCSHYNTETVSVIDCLGLSELDINRISIYPNPTSGQITILTGDIESGNIIVKDVIGKTIASIPFNSNSLTVDLGKYQARGTYFIEFYDETSTLISVKHVVKQ